tara:strand:+ start:481 stop:1416 length:936 start_codon:yes stop_codon:yes gene_type:complete
MSNISSEKIKSLREKTGAGIMDCKNALVENNGEIENAIDWLRKKGVAKADKKSSRIAAQGLVGVATSNQLSCIIEVNSETDFVSKNQDFQNFIERLLQLAIKKQYILEEFLLSDFEETTNVNDALKNIIAKIGENIVIRRLSYISINSEKSKIGFYIHNKVSENLGKIACLVKGTSDNTDKNTADLLKKIAMHVAASKPLALNEQNLDKHTLNREKQIFLEQLSNSGKPKDIVEKIVDGKVKKFISEITLLNQNWILEPSMSVSKVISEFNNENSCNFEILDYKLFILGEGIEMDAKDFKEEVASQLADTK